MTGVGPARWSNAIHDSSCGDLLHASYNFLVQRAHSCNEVRLVTAAHLLLLTHPYQILITLGAAVILFDTSNRLPVQLESYRTNLGSLSDNVERLCTLLVTSLNKNPDYLAVCREQIDRRVSFVSIYTISCLTVTHSVCTLP